MAHARELTEGDTVAFWDAKRCSFVVGKYLGPAPADLSMFQVRVSPATGTWHQAITVKVDDHDKWPIRPDDASLINPHGNYSTSSGGLKSWNPARAVDRTIAAVPPATMMILRDPESLPPGKIPWLLDSVIANPFVDQNISTPRDALIANAWESLMWACEERMDPPPTLAAALLRLSTLKATKEDIAEVGTLCPNVPDDVVANRVMDPFNVKPPVPVAANSELVIDRIEYRVPGGLSPCPNATNVPALKLLAMGAFHMAMSEDSPVALLDSTMINDGDWIWGEPATLLSEEELDSFPDEADIDACSEKILELIKDNGLAPFAFEQAPTHRMMGNDLFKSIVETTMDPVKHARVQQAIDDSYVEFSGPAATFKHVATLLDASLWLAITMTGVQAEAFVALAVEFNPIKASDLKSKVAWETAPDVAEALDRWVTLDFMEQLRGVDLNDPDRPIVQPLDQFITRLAGMTADEARSTRKHIEAVHKAPWVHLGQFFATWAKASNDTQMAWLIAAHWTNSEETLLDAGALADAVESIRGWHQLGLFKKLKAVPVVEPLTVDMFTTLTELMANSPGVKLLSLLGKADYMNEWVRKQISTAIKFQVSNSQTLLPRDPKVIQRVLNGLDGPCLDFQPPVFVRDLNQSDGDSKLWIVVLREIDTMCSELLYAGVVYADYRDTLPDPTPPRPVAKRRRSQAMPPAIQVVTVPNDELAASLADGPGALLRHLRTCQ